MNVVLTAWDAIQHFTGEQMVHVGLPSSTFYTVNLRDHVGASGCIVRDGERIEYIATAEVKTRGWRGPRDVILCTHLDDAGRSWMVWSARWPSAVQVDDMTALLRHNTAVRVWRLLR